MQHTLVAVFDNNTDAQKAMDELLASGFNRSDVRLSAGDSGTDTATSATRDNGDESIGDSIKNFFSDLFGSDANDRSSMYSNAVSRGNCVLTVTTQSEPEVERAADLVEAYGPIDIDEHHDMPMGADSDMRAAAMARGAQQTSQQTAQQSMQSGDGASVAGTPMSSQGTTTGNSRQFADAESQAIPVAREELNVGKREVQRGGVRIFSHGVEGGSRDVDEENRSHWNSNFASSGKSYEDVEPAYQYGSEMRRSELYRGRPFEDVETDLRADWNQRNPGSTWESIKAAVRHGWDRLRS